MYSYSILRRIDMARVNNSKTVGSMLEVWRGTSQKTAGGLNKKDLTLSKSGKVVSKKQQQAGFRLAKSYPPSATQAPPFGK